jgi:uncharacterized protein (TIGR00725 family)
VAKRKPTISVIGNGRLSADDPRRAIAQDLGHAIVDAGWRLVCGGMGGVMEAAGRGAHSSPKWKPGSVIGILPAGDATLANEYVDVALPTSMGHLRNSIVAQSDVVVALGGGAGTLSEMAFAWMYDRPIVAFRVEGWSGRLADTRIDDRARFDDDRSDEVVGVDTVAEAVEAISGFIRA